jgi:hypothetical protein
LGKGSRYEFRIPGKKTTPASNPQSSSHPTATTLVLENPKKMKLACLLLLKTESLKLKEQDYERQKSLV